MEVVLIAPYPDITALGVRSLSAQLNYKGISTKILFIPAPLKKLRFHSEFLYPYSNRELDLIKQFCINADLIGISFMSNYKDRAVQLTEFLNNSNSKLLVWGGVHPTAQPLESLDYVDIICRGEAEEAFLELCLNLQQDKDITSIDNFWFKRNGKVVKNPVRSLQKNLDLLQAADYRFNYHSVLDRDTEQILLLDEKTQIKYLVTDAISRSRNQGSHHSQAAFYQIMATRGCPHECTFCYNSEYKELYKKRNYLRRRSDENIIEELLNMKESSPSYQYVVFCDDSFFAASRAKIKHFSEVYKKKINLPFHCLGSPQTINHEKLSYLIEAGLISLSMGIQSGSKNTNLLYKRYFDEKEILKACNTINYFHAKLNPPAYDFIIDNPFESLDDQITSLKFIQKLPRPYHICLGSLVFFPGSLLYDKAKQDGLIYDEDKQIYHKEYHAKKGNYINFLFYLSSFMVSPQIMNILMNKKLINIFQKTFFNPFFTILLRGARDIRLIFRWLQTNL